MQKLFAFHTAVGVILLTLFYSQTATMSIIFSTQPLTPHSMRLAGLIFLLITIINAFAAFDTVERLALKIFPTGTKTATAIAALANALFVVHYGFEAFYYRDVNMCVSTVESSHEEES
jgi:hypothetical protein